jgi:hypothetical protein
MPMWHEETMDMGRSAGYTKEHVHEKNEQEHVNK